MKGLRIKKVERNGKMVRYTTNYHDRPDFVYPIGKFKNLIDAKTEIEKSIRTHDNHKEKKEKKIKKLKKELGDKK